jgi:hypothetical protein
MSTTTAKTPTASDLSALIETINLHLVSRDGAPGVPSTSDAATALAKLGDQITTLLTTIGDLEVALAAAQARDIKRFMAVTVGGDAVYGEHGPVKETQRIIINEGRLRYAVQVAAQKTTAGALSADAALAKLVTVAGMREIPPQVMS